MNPSTIAQQLAETRQRWPEVFHEVEPAGWRRVADAAVEGVLLFYGVEPVRVGRRDIDWSGAHKHHQEWVAQLNRFPQIDPLRWAYRLTGDETYAEAARDYVEDWISRHAPYTGDEPRPAAGESTLNMSVRLGGLQHVGWLAAAVDLAKSPAFDEDFLERMVACIGWQLDWLARAANPWGNWRVANLDALFSQALRLPERFGRHLAPAAEALSVEFDQQIFPDGVHVERSAGYHDWMCKVFVKLWGLGRRAPELGLRFDDARVVRMHGYTLAHTKPNGWPSAINDAHSRTDTDQAGAAKLTKVLADHRAVRAEAGLADDPGRLAAFPAAGQVFYRTGWGPEDLWWSFDAGGWGGGHTHLSRLAVELHAGGRTVLPDPGIFDYEMSNPLGPAGKATAAHSTMNVELANQADVGAELLAVHDLPSAVVACGRYAGGYWSGTFGWSFADGHGRGCYGDHHRIVVWLKDRAMIVLDCLMHDRDARAYVHWQLADAPASLDADGLGVTTGSTASVSPPGGKVRLRAAVLPGRAGEGRIARGEKDPYLGWVCDGLDPAPAPVLQLALSAGVEEPGAVVPAEVVTAIVPFAGNPPDFKLVATPLKHFVREAAIEWADGRTDRIVWTRRLETPIRSVGGIVTDAALAIITRDAGGGERWAALGGAEVRREG